MSNYFKNVVGQSRSTKILASHLDSRLISHAYLFLGREGVGKEYLAKEFARYIICGNKGEDDCPSCVRFKKGIHPDFIFIDGFDGIKIDQIREVVERINLTPSVSKKKVLLISGAENIGIEAANALLKTLEEPPADSVILITSRSEKRLPETIVSRTQVIKLNDIPKNEIEKTLLYSYPKEEIESVLSISGGSMGECIRLLTDKKYRLKQEEIRNDVISFLKNNSVLDRFKIVEKYEKNKSIKTFFSFLTDTVLGSLISDYGESTEFSEKDLKSISASRKKIIAEKILKNYRNLDYNINLRIILEEMILEDSLNG